MPSNDKKKLKYLGYYSPVKIKEYHDQAGLDWVVIENNSKVICVSRDELLRALAKYPTVRNLFAPIIFAFKDVFTLGSQEGFTDSEVASWLTPEKVERSRKVLRAIVKFFNI